MILKESSWGLETDKSYQKLTENIKADVVVIGAGFAGIFNAYILSKAGLKVVVLEKNEKILQNATVRTTAFISKVVDTTFTELISLFGEQNAKLVWESGQDAIDLISGIVKNESIDCEFKFVSAYGYAKDEKEFEGLNQEYEALKKAGLDANLAKNGHKLNFKNSGYLEIRQQAMFHPIKFGQELSRLAESAGAKIFTDSEVLAISGHTVKTKTGLVTAKDVVIATYKPITNRGTRFKKVMYVSYVFEVEILKGLIAEGMYYDMGNPYHYFRIDSFETFDRMIVGGEDHRMDIKINPDKNFYVLEEYLKTVLGNNTYKIIRKWPGRILESSDGLALMGRIKPHTYVLTGFSGNGMTYAPLSATIVRDLILDRKNPYTQLYDPRRNPSIRQLGIKGRDYMGEFFGGAFKNFFSRKKS